MSFPEEALTRDAFLGGRLQLWQPRGGYRAAIDPVLLAAFVPALPGQHVLELGCGGGTAALCLAARIGGLDLHGVEIQPDYADLARRNAAANRLSLSVHDGDVLALPPALKAASFDHVLTNPPFHPETDPAARNPGRDRAHRGASLLADWIGIGLARLRPGGTLALIHKPDALSVILAALLDKAGGIEILPVAPRVGHPASRVLVRARKASRTPLMLQPALALHVSVTGAPERLVYTSEADAVLRELRPLLPNARISGN